MRIVAITSRLPYPLEKGDKLRIFNQLKELSVDHEVILIAIDTENSKEENINVLRNFCKEVHVFKINKWNIVIQLLTGIFSSLPFQVHYYFNSTINKKIHQVISSNNPDIIHCHLIRVAEYVRNLKYKKLIDYMDTFSLGLTRRTSKQAFYLRWLFKLESDRVRKYESMVFDDFNAHTIISEQDRMYIEHPKRNSIKIINNGIASEFINYKISDSKEYDLLFTGNMSYQPNVDAAIYLSKLVNKLKVKYPSIKLAISGTNPTAQVLDLQNEHIVVTGWLPDLKTIYAKSRIFIAPMQIGTGLQNKLLEAMAMRVPCITSKLANNALKAINGEQIIECEQEDDYLNAIELLLNNQEKSNTLANNAYQFVINNYDWKSSVNELVEIYKKLNDEV